MAIKVQVIFYSMYGHVYSMAEAVAEGAKEVPGAEVALYQFWICARRRAGEVRRLKAARAAFARVPIATVDQLADAHAIIFGTPTRFGNMAAQMRNFLDQTGGSGREGAARQSRRRVHLHGHPARRPGNYTVSIITNLLHFGMVVVGVPYNEPGLLQMDEISGGTPYGATTLAGSDGSRQPTKNELKIALHQGKHVTTLAGKLFR